MSCENTAVYLHAYVDDELGVADAIRFEQHLATCDECRRAHQQSLALRTALRSANLQYALPGTLEKRVDRAIQKVATPPGRSFQHGNWNWLALAAMVLVAVGLTWTVANNYGSSSRQELLARAVVDSHIRSLQANHLVDVPSSDHHTVKPWFQGKLDFSPPVPDLAAKGWPLEGGRLDYIDSRPVAALVYQARKHQINVLVWPDSHSGEEGLIQQTSQGYQVLHWTRSGMTYWVTSDVNAGELMQFAQALRQL